jgi:hypothetical protein
MNPERAEGLSHPIEGDISDALIAHCNLSSQDVDRITETMREQRQSFCETAFQLNLATREDITDVLQRVREHSRVNQPSLIETAIRSAQRGTAVTVRQGTARLSSALIHARDSDSTRGEKIRALRSDLMLLNDLAQRGNVFALVGPGRGEGRSQLCAELAISFAQLGRRTILVDADLRHPRQHVLFGAENQWGLAQSLSLGEAPYLHGVEGLTELSLLTSGPLPPNPLVNRGIGAPVRFHRNRHTRRVAVRRCAARRDARPARRGGEPVRIHLAAEPEGHAASPDRDGIKSSGRGHQ